MRVLNGFQNMSDRISLLIMANRCGKVEERHVVRLSHFGSTRSR